MEPAQGRVRQDLVRIVLIDDHPIFLSGVRSLLSETDGIAVVGEASEGRHALDLVRRTEPDVVVMDITMTGMSGLAVARSLRAAGATARIVFLTVNEDRAFVDEALAAGGQGYVLKRSAGTSLLAAIAAVLAGAHYVDAELRTPSAAADGAASAPVSTEEGGGLTAREREVLRLIALGMTMKEVSIAMSISAASVDTYKIRGCKKLGLRSRASIVRFAIGQGWLESENRKVLSAGPLPSMP